MHLTWAAMLTVSHVPTGVTAIHAAEGIFPHYWMFVGALWVVVALAGIAMWRGLEDRISFIFLIPQQYVLTYSAVAAGQAIWLGQYGDGVLRPSLFIAADQLPVILIAVFHSLAIIDPIARREWIAA